MWGDQGWEVGVPWEGRMLDGRECFRILGRQAVLARLGFPAPLCLLSLGWEELRV